MRTAKKILVLFPSRQAQYGGAAMEYIIVSCFAAVASMAAIGFVTKVFNEKLASASQSLDIDVEQLDLGSFYPEE